MNTIQPTPEWFAQQGFQLVPPQIVGGRTVYAHPDGIFLNERARRIPVQPLRCTDRRYTHGGTYPDLGPSYGWAYCHIVIACTFIRIPDDDEQCDHINGDLTNFSLGNIRIVKRSINSRDGGFLRKLRNSGINPAEYSPAVLLRYYDRMAHFRATHTPAQYTRLTRPDLLALFTANNVAGDVYEGE